MLLPVAFTMSVKKRRLDKVKTYHTESCPVPLGGVLRKFQPLQLPRARGRPK